MMDDDNYLEHGSLVCLDGGDGSDTAWLDVLQQPAGSEVVIEACSPCQDSAGCTFSHQPQGIETGLYSDSQSEQSTHRTHAMQTVTELIGHDTQTSVEHVSEIIKHESGAAPARKAPEVHQRSPSVLSHRKPRNVIKKVIIMQPGDDAEQLTANAINEITADLNIKAARKMAQGETPDKETVIEITRINTPINGPRGRNQAKPVGQACPPLAPNQSVVLPQPQSPQRQSPLSPAERKHHRRKSPHPKRYMYHTPSPPQSKSRHSRTAHSLNADCYFESRARAGPSTTHHATASSKLLGLATAARPLTPIAGNTAQTFPHSHTASAKLQSAVHQSKPSILRNMRQTSDVQCSGQVRPVLGHDTMVCPSSVSGHLTNYGSGCPSAAADRTTPVPSKVCEQVCDTASQAAKPPVPASATKLNESLTNIQWLGSMSGDPLDRGLSLPHKDTRVIATDKQIDMISQECGRKKRPPYSYMHLIQMAICSSEEKRMTLKEIYQWIEEKFPFYKFCPNQGWKNSIRHNLSLYDIFVREKMLTQRGKAGCSYWTLRPDVPVKAVRAIQNLASGHSSLASEFSTCNANSSFGSVSFKTMDSSSSMSPSLTTATCHYGESSPSLPAQGPSSSFKKKGPVPLLPKPPAMQTYALIPIQAGVPVVPQQPIVVSSLTPTTSKTSIHRGPSKETRIRPASATDFMKSSGSQRAAELQGDAGNRGRRPGSAFELMRSSSIPAPGAEVLGSAQKSVMPSLLAGIEIKPEGMSTPPPQYVAGMKDGFQEKYMLKRSRSFTPEYAGPSHKLPKLSVKASHTYPNDHCFNNVKKSAVITRSRTQTCEQVEGNSSVEVSSTNGRTSHVRFVDSGFISDSSANDQTVDTSGLPKPIMYMSVSKAEKDNGYILTRTPSDCSSDGKSTLLSVDCSTEAGLHDILSSIEKSLSSPMRNLLRTPPKSEDKNLFTSTPFKVAFESPSWMSPIKGLTPIAGDPSLEGTLFTPLKDAKAVTSTPTYKIESVPQPRDTRTPPEGNQKEVAMFSFPSLTPLKTPFKSPASKDPKPSCSSERSPTGAFANQSFSKFLGEFPFESMIDEGINMDVSNMSFSAFQ